MSLKLDIGEQSSLEKLKASVVFHVNLSFLQRVEWIEGSQN